MGFVEEFASIFWQGTVAVFYGAVLAGLEVLWNLIYTYGLDPNYAFPNIYDSSWNYSPSGPEIDAAVSLHSTVFSEIAIPAALILLGIHALSGLISHLAGLRRKIDPILLPFFLSLVLARVSPFAVDVLLDTGRAAYSVLWGAVPEDLPIQALFSNFSVSNALVMTFFAGYMALILLGLVFFVMARMAYILLFLPLSPIASMLLAVPMTRRLGALLWRVNIELILGMVAVEMPLALAGRLISAEGGDISLFILLGLSTTSLALPLLVHQAAGRFLGQFSVSAAPAPSAVRSSATSTAPSRMVVSSAV